MKRKTFFTALAFVIIFTGFIYLKPNSDALENSTQLTTPPAPQTDKFLFGATDSWQDVNDNYTDYEQPGLNVWHTYMRDGSEISGRMTPKTPLAD